MTLVELVRKAQHVLVTSHISPDADGISSCLAFRAALNKLGKDCTIALGDPVPPSYRFLPKEAVVVPARPEVEPDLIVVLDLSDLDRLGPVYDPDLFSRVPILNVDHHVSNQHFGTVNVVDPTASATCELLYDVIQDLGVEIDSEIATWLLAGLVADTQGFRTPSTTVRTLRVAAELMDRGASLSEILEAVFRSRSFPALRLWGLVLVGAKRQGNILWSEITPDMLKAADASLEEVDGVVNLLASVQGPDAVVLFKAVNGDQIRVSMRTSENLNAAEICAYFGGGGHARAAGCTLEPPLEEAWAKFLRYVEERLEESEPSTASLTSASPRA